MSPQVFFQQAKLLLSCQHADFQALIQVCLHTITTNAPRWFVLLCYSAPSGNGVVRLWRSGNTSSSYFSGRVQIYYNKQWGSICDDSQFGLTEAHVICHQLGYTGASSQSKASLDE